MDLFFLWLLCFRVAATEILSYLFLSPFSKHQKITEGWVRLLLSYVEQMSYVSLFGPSFPSARTHRSSISS